jgi:membrane-associated phospholipid phosphatase
VAAPADRLSRLTCALLLAYLLATCAPMLAFVRAAHDWSALAAHLVALALAGIVVASDKTILKTARDWLPLALGPFLYVELRWLIPGVGAPHADALLQRWELAVFPSNPSATWATHTPSVVLSEMLHLAYASYYAVVLVPPILLLVRGRRDAYARTLLALTLVYGACFLTYLVFPVDGPRYLLGPATAPDGPVRTFVLHLLAAGSSRGTAFPSSHVAASVVASLCALQFQRPVGIVVSALTVGLALGTVYGGFHYVLDALAGGIVGLSAWFAARALCRALSTPGEQRATAA